MESYIFYFLSFITFCSLHLILYKMILVHMEYKFWEKGFNDSKNISDKYISELKCGYEKHISETEKDGYENLIKLEQFYVKEINKINNRLNKNDFPPLSECKDKKNIN